MQSTSADLSRPQVNRWLIAIAVMSSAVMEVLDTSVVRSAISLLSSLLFTMPACRQNRKLVCHPPIVLPGTSISERCGRQKTVRVPETVFGEGVIYQYR
jgi:hypothetical protein